MTAKWKYSEPSFEPIGGNDFGSGYPSDPKCKEWMEKKLRWLISAPRVMKYGAGITVIDGLKSIFWPMGMAYWLSLKSKNLL